MAYDGNIEVISGFKPKNNGKFALINAPDVQVDADGTRLDEKLKQLGSTEAAIEGVLASPEFTAIQQSVTSLEEGVENNSTEINAIGGELSDLRQTVEGLDTKGNEYDITYEDNILTLLENEEIKTQVTIVGGGGGGGESSIITIDRITPSDLTILFGEEVLIEYNFTSVDTAGDDTGSATATWSIGGRIVKTETIQQGKNSTNIGPYLSAGRNDVKLSVTDSVGSISSKRWSVNAIEMYIESNFNDSQFYSGNAIFRYTPYGDVEKTIHFILDGSEFTTAVVNTSGRQQSITIPHQPHGSHSLRVYATANINGLDITSNSLYFDIIFIDADRTEPIIKCAYDGKNGMQYTAMVFKYTVYTPGSLKSNVTLAINGETVSTLIVDRTEQTWSYKPTDYGKKVLTITSGSTVKTLNVTIDKFPYDIGQITDGLELDFNPSGRTNSDEDYNIFEYGSYKMTVSDNFDWQNGGWKVDEDGNSFFCVKAGTTMSIDYPLFGTDAKITGKDFKFIYKATMCRDANAKVMECFAQNIGVKVNAQKAFLQAGGHSLEMPYGEESYMELEFDIQPSSTFSEMLGLINADYSKIEIYTDTDNFDQRSVNNGKFEPITFGSSDCDVWIYRFKAYNKYLNDDEILDNRIADAPDSEEMANRFLRNQITNAQGEIDYQAIAEICPDLRIILISCPQFTKGKKDKVPGCTVQQIYRNGGAKQNWIAENVTLSGQGTSSEAYGDSGRNMDIKCSEGFRSTIDNTTFEKYAMTDGGIGESYFNIKVNIASSENANNALFADEYNLFQPYLRPARIEDPRVRDTMEFHPCVVFVREENLASANQFNDGNYHFYACGDFGNSKKNRDSFGLMNDELWKTSQSTECIIEIDNNTAPQCRFKSADFSTETWDGNGAIEFRYPDIDATYLETEHGKKIKNNIQRLWDWVVSTDADAATNRALTSAEKTEVSKWGETYTTDSANYRLAKFKNQFEDYFIKDATLYHYLFTERHCMVDNRAKNTFIHTLDGIHWEYVFDYDNDTADGNDNEGGLTLDYGLEDIDKIGDRDVFNAADSVLWVNIRKVFFDDLKALFTDRESAGAWDAKRIIQKFDDYQWVKPERLNMVDMRRKYLRPYEGKTYPYEIPVASTNSYLSMLYGRKTYQRNRFETNQEKYMSSKYLTGLATSDVATIRAYARGSFAVTPYADMYVNIRAGSMPFRKRAKRGELVTFELPEGTIMNDTETYFYTCSLIQQVGDLSGFYPGYCNFSMAKKLQKLVIGSGNPSYSNTNFTTLSFKSNELLEYLDIRNCPNFTQTLDLSSCVGLKTVYSTGTNASGVIFASGGLLENAYLNAIQSLIVKNLSYVKTLSIASYNKLTSLVYDSCSSIDSLALVQKCINLLRARILGINWSLPNTDLLEKISNMSGIDENNNNAETSVLAGSVYTPLMRLQQLQKYNRLWPNLTITYDREVPQYKVTFKNEDGTILWEEYVDQNATVEDPVKTGKIETPTKPSTDQFDYTFSGWDGSLTNIGADRTLTATYSESLRKYTVTWRNGVEGINAVLLTKTVEYGSAAIYDGVIPTRKDEEVYAIYYLFKGWDKGTSYITGDLDVNALWLRAEVPTGKDLSEMNPAEIYAAVTSGQVTFEDKDYTDIELGYMPTYENIREEVLAENEVFDGTKGIDTKIKLFDTDKSFVLALDFEYAYKANSGLCVMAGCYQGNTDNGFLLQSNNNSSPTVKWGSANQAFGGGGATANRTFREICVIRHIKGDNNLYLYTNNRFSMDSVQKYTLAKSKVTSATSTLSFGGQVFSDGSFLNYATGTLYHAKIWWEDIGEPECQNIASWIYTTMRFEYCGSKRYYYSQEDTLNKASFISKNLLDNTIAMNYTGTNTGGWKDSTLKNWLNTKFYDALPILWKQLIKQVQIPANEGWTGESAVSPVSSSACYIYIPAFAEMAIPTTGGAYAQEGTKISWFNASGDVADPERVKKLNNGVGAISSYWTRTADIEYGNSNYLSVNEKGEVGLYNTSIYASGNSGVCVAFSI